MIISLISIFQMKLFPELQLELQIRRDDRPSPPPPPPPEVFDLLLNQFPMLPDEEKLGFRCQKRTKTLFF